MENKETLYSPIIDEMVWSFSRIKTYKSCPFCFYLKYILNSENKEDRFYASYGSFVHKLIEKYYRGEIPQEDLDLEFMIGFSENVKGARPSDSITKSYIRKGQAYFEQFEPFPYEMVDVEHKLEFDVGGLPFVGYIDYLGKDGDDFIIIDNKSKELKCRSKRHKPTKNDEILDEMLLQLYIYALGTAQKHGKLPVKLAFNCFKNQTFICEDLDPKKVDEAVEWVKNSVEEIRQDEVFKPKPDFFYCHYLCDMSGECPYKNMKPEDVDAQFEVGAEAMAELDDWLSSLDDWLSSLDDGEVEDE